MPQLEQIDTYLSQVFWLLVTFGVLFVFLRRVALPRIAGVLESRRERIEADLDKAANLKAESETILAEYEAAMADGRSRALAVVRKAADEMAQEAARQNAALGAKLAKDIEKAEARIAQARTDAIGQITDVAAEAAQAATARLIDAKVTGQAAVSAVAAAIKERG